MNLTAEQIEALRIIIKSGLRPADEQADAICDMAKRTAEAEKDAERIDRLAALYKVCPHAVLTWNDDPDDEAPMGFSISIDGCEPVAYAGETLRDLLDKISREFDALRSRS